MRPFPIVMFALASLALGSAAWSQDLNGDWDFTADLTLAPMVTTVAALVPCEYTGSGTLTHANGAVSGTVDLTLATGPRECPGQMTGMLSATTDGKTFDGTLDGGKLFGMATIQGTINPMTVASPAPANTAGGSTDVTSGPYSGGGGTFTGTQQVPVPTLTPLALAALALLLFGASAWLLTRRRPAGLA